MNHVSFMFHADRNELHVHLTDSIPQLTPLVDSHPNVSFSPDDPWFQSLDPSTHGMAFNRQYGFAVDGESDPLPAGSGIWIRMVGGNPNLKVFRYRSSEPKAWQPMFGIDGSETLFQWGLTMFHPAFSTPPNTGAVSAEFEAIMVNLDTGESLDDIASAHFTLEFGSAVEEPVPTLAIKDKIVLSWPEGSHLHIVETADSPDSLHWLPLMDPKPMLMNGMNILVLPKHNSKKFFRLRKMEDMGGNGDHDSHEGSEVDNDDLQHDHE